MAVAILKTPRVRVTLLTDQEKLRRRIERAVDKLLAALDRLDGDPDFEDGHDREAYCEDEGAITGDDEPWLNPATGNGSFDYRDLEIERVYVAADEDQRRVPSGHFDGRIIYAAVS